MLPSVTCAIVVLFLCSAVVWDNEFWTGKCFDESGPSEGERLGYAAWFLEMLQSCTGLLVSV